ncbi:MULTISPECIES: urease accessory protein UreF [Tenebrionibacter/Tenebrionicola group]|jgi:urease accessory protein|uniref:Urease accessory protein UreF n=2 Tax=Tenebrionibacter/Tenebrionicola group TaxID=2969848 RepID=A0A8K0XX04_9ENTR|nr:MULTISPECIES: urease accessory protein UreF [Tenebrionibacter/Tenebrionicola group]MBK4716055.1 urease accessory protein UreF [Tenebrionibacter intestinalis]MBV5096755.1 urease accessory protein UreF [Tenebrionicola larvae]
MNAIQLIRIMQFSDSVLPVGAFSFSSGVESAIQAGIVHDVATLTSFTYTALQQAASGDSRAVAATCRALREGDCEAAITNDWALFNRKLNEESRTMVVRMGKKLAEMAVDVCKEPLMGWWLEQIKRGYAAGTYPVTQALVMTALGASPREVIVMHHYGVAMTILSAAMRLMRVTHIETQRILFQLNQDAEVFCDEAESGGIEQMSSYAPVTDVLAALHVAAFTRLFSN